MQYHRAINYKSLNALATCPFTPDDLNDDGKADLQEAFPDIDLNEVKLKSKLSNEADIIAQAKILADKYAPLLNKAR